MAITLKRLEDEAAKKRAELEEIETAIRVHQRMEAETGEYNVVLPSAKELPKDSLAGKTICECAEIILTGKGSKSFKEIAVEAMRRGYTSPKGGDAAAITRSFWATMNRTKDKFKSEGGGKYSLIHPSESPS